MCYIKPTEELEPVETSDDVVFAAEFTPMEEDSEYTHSTPAQDDGEYSQTTSQQQELQQQCCCCKNLKKIINKLNEIENQLKNLNS